MSPASHTGNAAGGEYTIFAAVIAIATVPLALVQVGSMGSVGVTHVVLGAVTGAASIIVVTPLTQRRMQRSGPDLLSAMTSGDLTRLRAKPAPKAPPAN